LNLLIQIPVIPKLVAKNISLQADGEFINLVGLAVDVVSDLGSVLTMDALMLKFNYLNLLENQCVSKLNLTIQNTNHADAIATSKMVLPHNAINQTDSFITK
jgi:hypothetical protein